MMMSMVAGRQEHGFGEQIGQPASLVQLGFQGRVLGLPFVPPRRLSLALFPCPPVPFRGEYSQLPGANVLPHNPPADAPAAGIVRSAAFPSLPPYCVAP